MVKSGKNDLKKALEKEYLLKFLKAAKLEYDPKDLEDGNDRDGMPDFILHKDNQRIGIELKRLFKDTEGIDREESSLKRRESDLNKKIKALSERYYSQSNIPIKVELESELPNQTDEFIQALIEYATRIPELAPHSFEFEDSPVQITRMPLTEGKCDIWRILGESFGWVSELDIESLKGAVKEKESKVPDYKRHADIVYLLIYSEFGGKSGFFRVPKIRFEPKETTFDKVYFFSQLEGSIDLK